MDTTQIKQIIGFVAVALTFLAYIPYYRDILRGKTHPHIYSWSLWGLLTILIVALQIKGGAGPAVYITAAAGVLCVAVLAIEEYGILSTLWLAVWAIVNVAFSIFLIIRRKQVSK